MILKKLLGLVNLTKAQVFYIYELTEVITVNKEKDLIFTTLKVIVLNFKGFNNSQAFLIIYFVASLGRDHFLREKND